MKKIVLLLFFSLSACAIAVEKGAVDNTKLILDTKNCVVTFGADNLELDIKPNCLFVKHSQSNEIRSQYYKDIDSHVVLVLGGVHHVDSRRPVTQIRKDCGISIRAVLIKDKKATLSSEKFDDFQACAGTGMDEKVFHMLSHPFKKK